MEIKIEKPEVSNRSLRTKIKVPEKLRKYFLSNVFYATYDIDIKGVPEGILNIPALSTVLHLAWATGSDIKLETTDKKYLIGIYNIQRMLKNHISFNFLPFKTKIAIKRESSINYKPFSKGLLFSGGVDSSASAISHHYERPELIMIAGLDLPLEWKEFWDKIIDTYASPKLRIIESNTEFMYNKIELAKLGSKFREGYRATYAFSVNALGICAPLTYKLGMGKLMLSSTYPSREYGNPLYPWTKDRYSFVYNQWFRWGGTRCLEVDHEYSKPEKIKYFIKPFYEKQGSIILRSCGHMYNLKEKFKLKRLNCSECDKCQRVIGTLILYDIDPNKCGFVVNSNTIKMIKRDIIVERWNRYYSRYHWSEIKNNIPDKIENDYYGSTEFFKWLRKYKL